MSFLPGPDSVINAEAPWTAPRSVLGVREIRLLGGWPVLFCWG
jgi:hypothetical protein